MNAPPTETPWVIAKVVPLHAVVVSSGVATATTTGQRSLARGR